MVSYYDGQVTDLLPHNLTDSPEAQAYSHALREGTRLLYRYAQLCYVYCNIDTMPGSILDLLSKELRTQYYRDDMPVETKRELVRNTLSWYMSAGTPAAVEELVTAVFGNGRVEEWFEYGGEPYSFKIKISSALTQESNALFSSMIRYVKNTRSHLETIEISRPISQNFYAGIVQASHIRQAAVMQGIGKE